MGYFGQTCVMVNRTSKVLNVFFDGREYKLRPGENPEVPIEAIRFAKAQNPLMGSEDPYDPTNFISLVGVKGQDDCSPLEESQEVERLDRKRIVGEGSEAKKRRGVSPTRFDAQIRGVNLEADTVNAT